MSSTSWLQDFDWSDITPVAHKETPGSLSEIMYSEDYKTAIGYLRAVMASNEHSARALAVVQAVIEKNPAHYTAWHYRLEILRHVGKDIIPKTKWIFSAPLPNMEEEDDQEEDKDDDEDEEEEDEQEIPAKSGKDEETDAKPMASSSLPKEDLDVLTAIEDYEWLNDTTLENAKNYQVWHYRQQLAPRTSPSANRPETVKLYYGLERLMVELVLGIDAKNYHAWSHLVWLVSWFGGVISATRGGSEDGELEELPVEAELAFVENLLYHDVYNNSAWSYRHFTVRRELQRIAKSGAGESDAAAVVQREVTYVRFCLDKAPQNESPWNYVVALLDDASQPAETCAKRLDELADLALGYVPLQLQQEAGDEKDSGEIVLQSTHAVEVLVGIYSKKGQTDKATRALKLLKKYIPMRRGYWSYLESRIPKNKSFSGVIDQASKLSVGGP